MATRRAVHGRKRGSIRRQPARGFYTARHRPCRAPCPGSEGPTTAAGARCCGADAGRSAAEGRCYSARAPGRFSPSVSSGAAPGRWRRCRRSTEATVPRPLSMSSRFHVKSPPWPPLASGPPSSAPAEQSPHRSPATALTAPAVFLWLHTGAHRATTAPLVHLAPFGPAEPASP